MPLELQPCRPLRPRAGRHPRSRDRVPGESPSDLRPIRGIGLRTNRQVKICCCLNLKQLELGITIFNLDKPLQGRMGVKKIKDKISFVTFGAFLRDTKSF